MNHSQSKQSTNWVERWRSLGKPLNEVLARRHPQHKGPRTLAQRKARKPLLSFKQFCALNYPTNSTKVSLATLRSKRQSTKPEEIGRK